MSREVLKYHVAKSPSWMSDHVQVQQVDTLEELESILLSSGDAIVCVDFTATWCSPCQTIAPVLEQLAQELTDVVFLKVDVDENEVCSDGCAPSRK